MENFLMYGIGVPAMIGIAVFYVFFAKDYARRFYSWVFVREYIMTSDTIISVVGWWKMYAKERVSPPDVVHWSPEGDTEDDGEWWKKG